MKTMTYSESRAHARTRTSMRIGLPVSRRCCSEDFSVVAVPPPRAPTRARGGVFCPDVLPHAYVVRRQAVSFDKQSREDAPISVQNCRACAPLPV